MIPKISNIPLLQLASGDRLSLQVYKFIGTQSGKKAYLQANLHGAEIVGNAVIHQLIEFLLSVDDTQLVGEIWLVPVCNPMSTNVRSHFFSTGRFSTYEGRDWNRIFWDYEKEQEDLEDFAKSQIDLAADAIKKNYAAKVKQSFARLLAKIHSSTGVSSSDRFSYQLQSLCLDADYVIDLHSSSNQGLDYLFYFPGREKSAGYFLLDQGILLDKYDGDAFDEAFIKPWLALEEALKKLDKQISFDVEAWTLELGSGMQMNSNSVAKGVRGIKNYLFQKGILAISSLASETTIPHKMMLTSKSKSKKYYAPAGGMIQERVPLESLVKSGQKIYQILSFNKIGELPSLIDVYAEEDGLVYDVSTNHAVNEGEYVLAVM